MFMRMFHLSILLILIYSLNGYAEAPVQASAPVSESEKEAEIKAEEEANLTLDEKILQLKDLKANAEEGLKTAANEELREIIQKVLEKTDNKLKALEELKASETSSPPPAPATAAKSEGTKKTTVSPASSVHIIE